MQTHIHMDVCMETQKYINRCTQTQIYPHIYMYAQRNRNIYKHIDTQIVHAHTRGQR